MLRMMPLRLPAARIQPAASSASSSAFICYWRVSLTGIAMDDARYGESGSPEPLFRLAAALPEKKKEDDDEEEEEEEEEANRSGGIK